MRRDMKHKFKIVDDTLKKILFTGTLTECEIMLEYFLSHDHDAFIELF
jgi:hypothetical protein